MVIKQAACALTGHHLHGSSSSLNHWATSSTFSPAAHRHCICLQHVLLTALKTESQMQLAQLLRWCNWFDNYNYTFYLPKTEPERLLVAAAVRKARTGRLGLTDATSFVTPVNLWLVKAEHRFLGLCNKNWKYSPTMSKPSPRSEQPGRLHADFANQKGAGTSQHTRV